MAAAAGLLAVPLASRLAGAVGWGGGEPVAGTQVFDGRLVPGDSPALPEDGSLYEDHRVRAEAGWQLTARMESDEFDAWLQLFGPDGRPLGQNDDGPEGGTDAWLSLPCPADGTYVLRANARDPGMSGAYRLEVLLEGPDAGASDQPRR